MWQDSLQQQQLVPSDPEAPFLQLLPLESSPHAAPTESASTVTNAIHHLRMPDLPGSTAAPSPPCTRDRREEGRA